MSVIEQAIQQLRQWHRCPACRAEVTAPACASCGLELTGEPARLLVARSEAAARALELRQEALASLVSAAPAISGTTTGPSARPIGNRNRASAVTPAVGVRPAIAQPPAGATRPAPPPPATRQVNPVAVFSGVGVGAIVAAALVFASLVPADPTVVRAALVGVTAAFALAMFALRRRRPVSAAAMGVGTVLLCLLVIWLFVQPLPARQALLAAALAVGGLAVGLGAAGFALRLRPWVSAGILLAPIAAVLAAGSYLFVNQLWGTAFALVAAVALAAAGSRVARRWQGERPDPLPLAPERALLGLGAGVVLLAATGLGLLGAVTDDAGAGPVGGLVLLAAAGAAYLHGTAPTAGWRWTAGVVAVLAPVAFVLGSGVDGFAACATAGLAWIALAAASRLPALQDGGLAGVLKGGWAAALALAVPGVLHLVEGVLGSAEIATEGDPHVLIPGWELPSAGWAVAGLLVAAAQCAVAASLPPGRFAPPTGATAAPVAVGGRIPTSDPGPAVLRVSHRLWPWLALLGLAAAAALPVFATAGSATLLLVLALGCGVVARVVGNAAPTLRDAGRSGGGAVIVVAALTSWDSPVLALAGGAAVVALVLSWTQLVVPRARPVLVGIGYAYALWLLGHALTWYPLGWAPTAWPPVAGLVAVAASLVSLAVLAATRPAAVDGDAGADAGGGSAAAPRGFTVPSSYAVLAVGTVPWLLAIATVFEGRSWWAAAAAASMLAVELVMAVRPRRQPTWLRVTAAVSLLPTVGILLVNAGAMVIPTSGSPILLPMVAALAAATAIAAANWTARIAGIDDRAAGLIRRAFETGALLTAVACVVLAVVLPAAGPDTSLVVCAILAAGAAVVATQPDRHWVWVFAGLAAAGVLWSALVLFQVGVVEAYTVPVGAAALIVALILVRHDGRWWALAAAGLQLAVLPSWLLAAAGRDLLTRAGVLTAVAVLLLTLSRPARRYRGPGGRAPLWSLAAGVAVAGTAPVLLALRSSGRVAAGDPVLEELLAGITTPFARFAWVVATAAVAALLLGFAGQLVRWASITAPKKWRHAAASWRFAPAVAVAGLGAVLAVRPGEGVVLAMWLLCLGFLAVTVLATVLRIRGRVVLPPVWYCWLVALAVGIAGWSLRDLRVEHHSLPLGLVLLGCGLLAWRAGAEGRRLEPSWPLGLSDPAAAITPGVLATLGPSTLAIGTDPQTWRAILVLVMALAALLVGARKLWRACMVAGIVDLAVAVLLVFVARRGAIDAVPWLIALIGAGGVLLGLAIYSERRQHAVAAPASTMADTSGSGAFPPH